MSTRILVVEDEPSYRETLRFLLEKEGFEVETASNGLAGVAAFTAHGADLVLLDLMLPRLSGAEVFQRLRMGSDVPVIFLTAKDEQHHKIAGLEAGADDYVTKPFSSRELLARIRAVLRRAEVRQRAHEEEDDLDVEEARGIRLDPERLTMTRNGVATPLPPKEFALFITLMRSRGRVLTRGILIDRVWGSDFYGDTKTLDVHIKRLRSKIEATPGKPEIIMTVRGVGYTFEPDAAE